MAKEDTLKELEGLIKEAPRTNGWREKVEYRKKNRDWLRKSAQIAVKILRVLREEKITQVQLAEKMSVSPQQINKIIKGQENLTLETIGKIETALGIELVTIMKNDEKIVKSKEWESMVSYQFSYKMQDILQRGYINANCPENEFQLAG